MKASMHRRHGFSLIEVIFVIATVALLAGFLLPALSRPHSRGRAPRISCLSQLKQIGLSYRIYANDHGDQFPYAVSNQLGGSLQFQNSPMVFRHYEVMSNELNFPKVLVCPSDKTRIRAQNFETSLSNSNISYFVGMGVEEDKPQRILSGDRDITGGVLSNGFMRVLQSNSLVGWSGTIHADGGNVGLADGSVQQFTKVKLQQQLQLQDLPVVRLAIP
jgi:prepilin-type N-terminal cleavage/methylation domain-containing protein/prepilin-type processing-associated H-X9-DG protein